MAVPAARGGDGKSYHRIALYHSRLIHWYPVHPASNERANEQAAWELHNGFDWSEPQLEPPSSSHAGRWTSHSIVKGYVKLTQGVPPTFESRQGDFRIYNVISLVFRPQGIYMAVTASKQMRDLSQPPEQDASTTDGDQLPPYST